MSTAEKLEAATERHDVDVIEPETSRREFTIGTGEFTANYTMRPLSYFGKLDLVALLGKTLNKAMKDGLTIDGLLTAGNTAPQMNADGTFNAKALGEADSFLSIVTTLAGHVPDFMEDLYVTILQVPKHERSWVKETMVRPVDLGGLNDEDGLAIIDTFVDTEADLLVSFFVERLVPTVRKMGSKVQGATSRASEQSKPSKPTRRPTAKA